MDQKRRLEIVRQAYGYQPPYNQYGDQHWCKDDELGSHLKPIGVALGQTFSGKTIYSGLTSPHVTSIGSTAQFKTSSLISAIVDDSLRDSSLNITSDVAGELADTTARWRRGCGDNHFIDPYEISTRYVRGYGKPGMRNCLDLDFLNPLSPYFSSRAALISSLNISLGSGRDRYWYQASRQAGQGVIMAERKFGNPRTCNLPAIAKILTGDLPHYAKWMLPRVQSDPQIFNMLLRWAIAGQGTNSEIRSIAEVQQTLATELGWLLDPAFAKVLSSSNFSFRKGKHAVQTTYTILPNSVLGRATGAEKLFKLFNGISMAECMRFEGTKWMHQLADEAFIVEIEDLAEQIASVRKYRIGLWTLWQDYSGELCSRYPETHSTVMINSGCIQALSAKGADADHFSNELGDVEILQFTKTVNGGQQFNVAPFSGNDPDFELTRIPEPEELQKLQVTQNYSQAKRKFMLPQELKVLDGSLQILWFHDVIAPVLCKKIPYFKTMARYRVQPNPVHRG